MLPKVSRLLIVSYVGLLSLLIGSFIIYQSQLIGAITANALDKPALRFTIIIASVIVFILSITLTLLFTFLLIRPILNITNKIRTLSLTGFPTQPAELDRNSQPLKRDVISYITDLQKELQDHQSKRIRLEEILDLLNEGVILVSADGSIQFLNHAAKKMFTVAEDQGIDKSLVKVCRHHAIVELWKDTLLSGESHQTSVELARQQLFLQVTGIPLTGSHESSILLIFQDITKLRYLETVRKDFISNISHELRTPLASLKALIETLHDSIVDDPPAAKRFLNNIEIEVDLLALLVQELIELARIESGKVPLQMKLVAPASVIHSAIYRLWLQVERKNLNFMLDLPPDLPEILIDPVRLEQVVVNLLHNAIKFTPPGGEIKISAWDDPNSIIFAVEDTGVGISKSDLPRIFERFYKVDRARSGGGTGLGLAIAKHLVEAHRGDIWVESHEGRGSTFYFSIPLSKT